MSGGIYEIGFIHHIRKNAISLCPFYIFYIYFLVDKGNRKLDEWVYDMDSELIALWDTD